MIRSWRFKLFFIYVLTIMLTSCSQPEQIVARVGNLEVTAVEYKALLAKHFAPRANYKELPEERKNKILENLIIRKLKLNAAYDRKLDKDPDFIESVNRYRNSLVQKRYYEKMVIDPLVPKRELEAYIENQKYEMTASHILIAYDQVNRNVTRTKDDAYQLAQDIVVRLQKGENFQDLARQYSDDPSAQQNSGHLGEFTWGQMVDPFQRTVWKMDIGQISEPVETQFGYHVIKLERRREREQHFPYDDEEQLFAIKQKLYTSRADSGRMLWEKHLNNLKDYLDFRIHTTSINKISIRFIEIINTGDIRYDVFTTDDLNLVLASWNRGSFVLRELFVSHKDRLARFVSRLKQIHMLKREVETQAINKLILDDARRLGLFEETYVQKYTRQMEEDQLEQRAEKMFVDDAVQINEDDAYQYYLEYPKRFENPAEIELWEIFVLDENLAKHLLQRAQKGENFTQLAKKYSQDKQYASKGGYLGFRKNGSRGLITRHAFENGARRIGGPVRYRNGWTVFKTGDLRPSTQRSFEEVKNRAMSLVRRNRIKNKRLEWEQNLRNLYNIEINTDLIQQV